MESIQMPVVAGMFYPADGDELRADVDRLLRQADNGSAAPPKAIIAPHAGYIYSGPVAASAYATLHSVADRIERVVLLAPSHRVAFRGMALASAQTFRTPLGDIEVDQSGVASIRQLPGVQVLDEAFAQEHALEVHLPFLQRSLSRFTIVPIVVGDADAFDVARVLETLWGGDETLIVVSSDLSHYMTYSAARDRDSRTSDAIEHLQPELVGYNDACGRNPVNGLLVAAREHGLKGRTLDLRNSGDTAGDRSRVVGYGAYVFS